MLNQVTNICRTCLGLDGPFLPIYENKPCEYPYGCVADMLDYTLNFKSSKTDGLSQFICEDCNKEINRSYSFKIKCENSNKLYRELFHIPDDVSHEQAFMTVVKFDTDVDQEHPQRQEIPHSTPLINKKVWQQPAGINKTINDKSFHTDFEFRVDLKDSITIEEPQLVMEIFNATKKNVSQQNPGQIEKNLPSANLFVCSKCQKAYSSPEELSIHFCYETTNESLNPSNTSINANNENNLKKPTGKHKNSHELSCPTCGKKYQLMFYLRKHMRTHKSSQKTDVTIPHGNLIQQVQLVSEGDGDSQALAKIIRQENRQNIQVNEKLCTCPKCKKTFYCLKELHLHDCSQSNNESLNESCTSISNTESNLKKHKIKKNSNCRYNCLACGKNYQLLFYLKKHMKTHKSLSNDKRKQLIAQIIEEDKAKITIYDKNFEPQQVPLNLENDGDNGEQSSHAFTENNDTESNDNTLYTCSKCQKDYPSQEELGIHDCNKTPFSQTDTSTSSIENTSLEINQNNGDNKSCSICGRKYQLLFYLRKHMKSHKSLSTNKNPAITIHGDLKQQLPLHFEGDAAKGLEKTKQDLEEDKSQQSQTPAEENFNKSNEKTTLRHSRRKKIQTTRMRSYLEEKTIHQRNSHPKEKRQDEVQNENCTKSTKKDSNPLTSIIQDESLQQKNCLPGKQDTKNCCSRCGCIMADEMALKMHIKRNKCTQKFFTCSICKRVFNSAANLNSHIQKHYEDNDYDRRPCTYPNCYKTFVSSISLKYHMDTHEKIKTFICLKCNKGFTKMQNLKRHLSRHNDSKRYKCQLCAQTFNRNSSLKVHLERHSGKPSHSCEFCDKKFFWRNSLTHHQRIHTGEMPYSCDICPQRFAYRHVFLSHRSTHTG